MELPEQITTEEQLEEVMTRPTPALVQMMRRLTGDIAILGIGGKMGGTLGMLARRATDAAGVARRILGVSRFSDTAARTKLDAAGIETIACDLLEPDAVAKLPPAENVIFMAGRKFGTQGNQPLTWAMNTLVPAHAAQQFATSRIVAFSTGCVYPLISEGSPACTEETPPDPIGEYAQSCLGRERIFQYYSAANATPICLYRLNYAIDLRYGVLHDIASRVWCEEQIDVSSGRFNLIWQGDANRMALQCLEACASPAAVLNVTGPEVASTREVAEEFGRLMDKRPRIVGGESGGVYLSDATRALELFGGTTVSLQQMIEWNAQWVMSGGRSLGKPTHFETQNGKY